ncbi:MULTISPECIES: hypothetical protein [unclassified Campylobacter]|uniref:hypothetical protein n=1 Tax=unclassified Campylobacter TaxID=2593542 RepID=UPI0022E9DA65|nr:MULTISPECIES: hypothetical protein [unclassified Campylobacter]MDA3055602.1 hypothetical protein [Campylobacter sp. CN_NA1]MDA3064708.1 hypothetical protein [Campylobacter sp. CN_NE4]MDA3068468.1 hypothetical protein [Campylobacter sp. CN_NE3]MDA3082219.1 hypothetical protein [Campylobacter sp. CN_EL2]MDA3083854.1 hypothetical protein [Campylobacter sp. CN_NE1]
MDKSPLEFIVYYLALFVFLILINLIYKKKIKFSKTNMERFNKIKNSEIYQRFIGRALLTGKAISFVNILLYFFIFYILYTTFLTATRYKPLSENQWYKTVGIVDGIYKLNDFGKYRSGPIITILTDNNKTINFTFNKKNEKIRSQYLKGKKVTIYSKLPPYYSDTWLIFDTEAHANKIADESGNFIEGYDGMYDYEKAMKEYKEKISYKPFLKCLFILLLIYFINGNKNSNKNQNSPNFNAF